MDKTLKTSQVYISPECKTVCAFLNSRILENSYGDAGEAGANGRYVDSGWDF